MISDEEQLAQEYYLKIMTIDDVLLLKNLMSRMRRVPSKARDYLQSHCRDVRELEAFFREREHLFFVDNGRVALFSEERENAPDAAAIYLLEHLKALKRPVPFMELKSYLDDAPESVGTYIRAFYPSDEFKKFLKQRPNVFNLRKDMVSSIELDSVDFFVKKLKVFGANGNSIRFNNFRGHVSQAPPEIQSYMNRCYWGDDFQIFLRQNSNVFQLDNNGFVSLKPFV